MMHIHHCFMARLAATLKRARPARAMQGAIDRGPMKRSRKDMIPVAPMRTWNSEATMMAPWSWGYKTQHIRTQPLSYTTHQNTSNTSKHSHYHTTYQNTSHTNTSEHITHKHIRTPGRARPP